MAKADDIVLAKRKEGTGTVRVASELPELEGWEPSDDLLAAGLLHEGETIPMRRQEATERDDFELIEPPKKNKPSTTEA